MMRFVLRCATCQRDLHEWEMPERMLKEVRQRAHELGKVHEGMYHPDRTPELQCLVRPAGKEKR